LNLSEPAKPPPKPIETLTGVADKKEGGFFDPLKLSEGKDLATLNWYRAAELKHGRVAMLASVGVIVQGLNTGIIPGFSVTETNAFAALREVYEVNPFALLQVLAA
jgi:hypothetical protein